MERLTIWNEQTESAELVDWDEGEWKDFMESLDVPIWASLSNAVDELARYEDLEEQGLLLRLPCKLGDTFWELNNEFSEPTIYPRVAHSLGHVFYCLERLGRICFLTEKEAEEALQKMRGGE